MAWCVVAIVIDSFDVFYIQLPWWYTLQALQITHCFKILFYHHDNHYDVIVPILCKHFIGCHILAVAMAAQNVVVKKVEDKTWKDIQLLWQLVQQLPKNKQQRWDHMTWFMITWSTTGVLNYWSYSVLVNMTESWTLDHVIKWGSAMIRLLWWWYFRSGCNIMWPNIAIATIVILTLVHNYCINYQLIPWQL